MGKTLNDQINQFYISFIMYSEANDKKKLVERTKV
ncbi:hypothetical protein CLV90_1999 [Maribacter spongiicola]|uniref:Uncharacterized protein n=1 Tax=Maribacter spongiicola TaxID=1206753 RepID=A0A4R7K232_9FLAO|nr:hypothetical protein CLV90_1999 [Maribacter spongiicola]